MLIASSLLAFLSPEIDQSPLVVANEQVSLFAHQVSESKMEQLLKNLGGIGGLGKKTKG
jgi:hypothetical protein